MSSARRFCCECGKPFVPRYHRNTFCSQSCAGSDQISWPGQKEETARATKLSPKTGSFTTNIRAKDWAFRSPAGVLYEFRNIAVFVREHPDLFAPDDCVWVRKSPQGTKCNASRGLGALSPRLKHPAGSWKGWTHVFRYDAKRDLLARHPSPTKKARSA